MAGVNMETTLQRICERCAEASDTLLVQVWRIVERNGSRMVETKGQPHALSRGADASLARYRDQSCDFSLQLLRGAARAHLPGRVLLSGRCEWSPNVRLYRDDEFLRRARAQSLGVRATMAVPLFDPSAIGAASMDARLLSAPGIGPSPDVTGHASAPDAQAYPFLYNGAWGVLEVASLVEDIFFQDMYYTHIKEMLREEGVEVVAQGHLAGARGVGGMSTPLALDSVAAVPTSVPAGVRAAVTRLAAETTTRVGGIQSEADPGPPAPAIAGAGELLMVQCWGREGADGSGLQTTRCPFAVNLPALWGYRRVSCGQAYDPDAYSHDGLPIVSEAFASGKLTTCHDLTRASLSGCPLKQVAQLTGIASIVACVVNITTPGDSNSCRLVIELCFGAPADGAPVSRGGVEAQAARALTRLEQVAADCGASSVYMQFPEQVAQLATQLREREARALEEAARARVQAEQQQAVMQAMQAAYSGGGGGGGDGAMGLHPQLLQQQQQQQALFMHLQLQQQQQQQQQQHASYQQAAAAQVQPPAGGGADVDMSPPQGSARTTKGRAPTTTKKKGAAKGRGKSGKRETSRDIPLEKLQSLFCMSLNDAAKSLNLCTTTLKRACRAHGISRWPCRKLRKISCLDTSLQKLREEMTTGSYISGGSVLTGGTAITTTADTAAQPSVGGAAQLAIDAVQFPKNAPDGVQVQAVDNHSVHGPPLGNSSGAVGVHAFQSLVPAPEYVTTERSLRAPAATAPAGVPSPPPQQLPAQQMASLPLPLPREFSAPGPAARALPYAPQTLQEMPLPTGVLPFSLPGTPMGNALSPALIAMNQAAPPLGDEDFSALFSGLPPPAGSAPPVAGAAAHATAAMAAAVGGGGGPLHKESPQEAENSPEGVPMNPTPDGGTMHGPFGGGGGFAPPMSETVGTFGDPSDLLIKAMHGDDMVRVRMPLEQASLGAIAGKVSASLGRAPNSIKLRYADRDGDWIRLESAADFEELLQAIRESHTHDDQPLRLKLQVVGV